VRRPGEHGRPRRRSRGRREQPGHVLRRGRRRRRVEDNRRRPHLRPRLRRPADAVHWCGGGVPGEAGGGVRRHRRGEPAELRELGQRGLPLRRRRQDVEALRTGGHAPHRPRRGPPDRPGHRLRRGARPLLGAEQGPRAVQDDRRRQDVGVREVHRREHRVRGRADGPGRPGHALRGGVAGAARRLLRRQPARTSRPRRRPVQDDRRRQDVGKDGRRAAREGRVRAVRTLRLPQEPEGRLRGGPHVRDGGAVHQRRATADARRQGRQAGAGGARRDRRHLPVRGPGRDVEEDQRPRPAAVLLRPDPRGPRRREAPVRAGRRVLPLDRRRGDLRHDRPDHPPGPPRAVG